MQFFCSGTMIGVAQGAGGGSTGTGMHRWFFISFRFYAVCIFVLHARMGDITAKSASAQIQAKQQPVSVRLCPLYCCTAQQHVPYCPTACTQCIAVAQLSVPYCPAACTHCIAVLPSSGPEIERFSLRSQDSPRGQTAGIWATAGRG